MPKQLDLLSQSPTDPAYEHATDIRGAVIHPGDRVSIKTYPRGTVRGVVGISQRATSIVDGVEAPALIVTSDEGVSYNLPGSKSVRKLKQSAAKRSKGSDTSAKLLSLIAQGNDVVNSSDAANLLGVSTQRAAAAIRVLINKGLIIRGRRCTASGNCFEVFQLEK